MNYHMGDFGQVEVPKVVQVPATEDNSYTVLKTLGILAAIPFAVLGIAIVFERITRKPYYYPDVSDEIEHYGERLKILLPKLDDRSISDAEVDELQSLAKFPPRNPTEYRKSEAVFRQKKLPSEIKVKLNKYFKSQGT